MWSSKVGHYWTGTGFAQLRREMNSRNLHLCGERGDWAAKSPCIPTFRRPFSGFPLSHIPVLENRDISPTGMLLGYSPLIQISTGNDYYDWFRFCSKCFLVVSFCSLSMPTADTPFQPLNFPPNDFYSLGKPSFGLNE